MPISLNPYSIQSIAVRTQAWATDLQNASQFRYGDSSSTMITKRDVTARGVETDATALGAELAGMPRDADGGETIGKLSDFVNGAAYWSGQTTTQLHTLLPEIPASVDAEQNATRPFVSEQDARSALAASQDTFSRAVSDAQQAASWAARLAPQA